MGFLDRMLGDLVAGSTPLGRRTSRRLIKKIGAKNILLAGGAALAGGALAGKGISSATSPPPGVATGGSGWSAPPTRGGGAPPQLPQPPSQGNPRATPPPPPSAGGRTTPPPPPPPVPPAPTGAMPPPPPATSPPLSATNEQDDDELAPEVLYPLLRTMVAAALADGHLSPEEKAMIENRLGESGLPEEQIRQIHRDLVIPPSPSDLAAMVSDPGLREALYRAGALVVLADDQLDELEKGWLDRLATACGFSPEKKAVMDQEFGLFFEPNEPDNTSE